ncbi:MAG: hypothetical protein IPO08_23755 [Xanthomonadales bacterium]|nr:hypothetical protein [Xanthomonadales bacterium]
MSEPWIDPQLVAERLGEMLRADSSSAGIAQAITQVIERWPLLDLPALSIFEDETYLAFRDLEERATYLASLGHEQAEAEVLKLEQDFGRRMAVTFDPSIAPVTLRALVVERAAHLMTQFMGHLLVDDLRQRARLTSISPWPFVLLRDADNILVLCSKREGPIWQLVFTDDTAFELGRALLAEVLNPAQAFDSPQAVRDMAQWLADARTPFETQQRADVLITRLAEWLRSEGEQILVAKV